MARFFSTQLRRYLSTRRRRSPFARILIPLVFALQTPSLSAADETILPFHPGEMLTYDLRWNFIHAGSAVLNVAPTAELNGIPAHRFVMTVRSSPFLDLFYKVRDRVEGYADLKMTRSLLYRNEQREGDYSRDVTVTFDWENETAQFENRGERKDPIFVHPGTFDPLSISYYLRTQELVTGKELRAPVTDGKRCVIGRVRVLGREEVKVPAGKFDTFLLEPVLGNLGGVVKRSEAASAKIWLTSDPRHMPVKVSSKVKVGSFLAVLVSAEPGTPSR